MNYVMSLALLCMMAADSSTQPAQPAKLADLGFIHGGWVSVKGETRTEEFWSPPRAGTMLGASRTIRGDVTVFFEYCRIEQRGEAIYYIAQPGGKAPTEFKLTQFDGKAAVFENPEHDFPNKIVYELIDQTTMKASIEGTRAGQRRGTSWELKRMGAAAAPAPTPDNAN
ncbi:MAG TPA: DUF6265 family protein [Tepidisphaeraceae bacterium]|nr:DUF6265 family protein [Tepidisphaeraceae bacterium]